MELSFKRSLAKWLDRRGGRLILANVAMLYVRWQIKENIQIQYKNIWFHKAGKYYFYHGKVFNYNSYCLRQISKYEQVCRSNALDYWFWFYSPNVGDTIIDIGAGRGEDTIVFSEAVGNSGMVIAIEAHPISFEHLFNTCQLNRLKNVTPLNIAVTSESRLVSMTELESWESNSICSDERSKETGMSIRADALDAIICNMNIKTISFLKMNIEGAETSALLGMEETIKICKIICVACHDFRYNRGDGNHFRTRAFVEKFLKGRGFRTVTRESDSRDYVRDHVFAVKEC